MAPTELPKLVPTPHPQTHAPPPFFSVPPLQSNSVQSLHADGFPRRFRSLDLAVRSSPAHVIVGLRTPALRDLDSVPFFFFVFHRDLIARKNQREDKPMTHVHIRRIKNKRTFTLCHSPLSVKMPNSLEQKISMVPERMSDCVFVTGGIPIHILPARPEFALPVRVPVPTPAPLATATLRPLPSAHISYHCLTLPFSLSFLALPVSLHCLVCGEPSGTGLAYRGCGKRSKSSVKLQPQNTLLSS